MRRHGEAVDVARIHRELAEDIIALVTDTPPACATCGGSRTVTLRGVGEDPAEDPCPDCTEDTNHADT